ncbi:hypothetical protein [Nonomuraea sp. B19D2]|uniref:hypothetical protein n=1 Tax=Nonomuraea sp. B19D2 TaxID=3159561 RepID=UPI0032DA8D64
MKTVARALDIAAVAAARAGEPLTVVHGGCPTGADAIASAWCGIAGDLNLNVIERVFEPDWTRGRKAGPERNRRMVEAGADLVIAFNRNKSRGTSGTIALAVEAGIPVVPFTIEDREAA